MKKAILAIGVVATLASCGGASIEATKSTVDSSIMKVDSTIKSVDTTKVDTTAVK